jgi:sulfur dioxygenase
MNEHNLIFRQMFESESSTFTYLIADKDSKEGILIDPVKETVDRDLKVINELGIKLKYIFDTHVHADHITGAGDIRKVTGAKSIVGENANVDCVDISIKDGDELDFGKYKVKAISTPGHTNGCMSYLVNNMIFTGDTLLIRGNGRTDFQEGSPEKLYNSITKKLFKLPSNTKVFPAHNYIGLQQSSIEEEMRYNPRIGVGKSLADFILIMENLNLPEPKKIKESVEFNKRCGIRHG